MQWRYAAPDTSEVHNCRAPIREVLREEAQAAIDSEQEGKARLRYEFEEWHMKLRIDHDERDIETWSELEQEQQMGTSEKRTINK